ncbi:RES family NAD+ phosphorylase [Mesorhizobium sp. M0152]|uniref:RES family NAD+ phosphorylase n=1 Tax=Mesorhizobium sp. M0152 TaxID=2956898 RepID=UPI0033369EFF
MGENEQDFEIDDDVVRTSLCADCARHPSVKKVIAADCIKGRCAFCARDDVEVRTPENRDALVMLLRALIRFFYDEHEYNSHWGGDSVLSLFQREDNPILKPPSSGAYLDDFDEWLQWPAYPDWDKGVAIYAGHDDGVRGMNFAISRTNPSDFVELQRRLLTENFFQVEPALEALVEPFLADIEILLPADELWYRARLGQKEVFRRYDLAGFQSNIVRQPWLGTDIGAPPPLKAGIGRLNRAGVSVLYLASDANTAVAEIRPHPGHHVSIGGFKSTEALRLADFNPEIALFSSDDARLSLYAIIQAFDRLMSLPVIPDERTPYLSTQLLAEVLLRRGFDGVRYRSSVSDGSNICVFYPAKFDFAQAHSEVRRVESVAYSVSTVPYVIVPGQDDLPYNRRI